MVISQLGLSPEALRGETLIVTGAGGGIGADSGRGHGQGRDVARDFAGT